MKLRISEKHYRELRKATAPSFYPGVEFSPETGCVLLIGKNDHEKNPALLVREILVPGDEDYAEQGMYGLTFSSRFLRKALLRVRELGVAGFLTCHTHPQSDEKVKFSDFDDANDPELMKNLYDLRPEGVFGSLVLGKRAVQGRLWTPDPLQPVLLDEMVVTGESLEFISLSGEGKQTPPPPAGIFDRGLQLSGAGALARLCKIRIGIVGVSGTGSIVAELLVRAGAGEIVLFEFDHIEEVNLNRILHARKKDADSKNDKSERLAEALKETGMPAKISVVNGNITEDRFAKELRSLDFIFGCVDDAHWARLVMTEICYQYLIPYIDLGTEIGFGDSGVQSVDSRVSYCAPGRICLLCSGIILEERVRLEGLAPDEKNRVLAMGYSKDAVLAAPAVMDLNMRASSLAALVLRHLLQPFMETPLPVHIKESVANFSIRKVSKKTTRECHICGGDGRAGLGDSRRMTTTL